MAEGVVFPFPSLPLNEGRTYGQVLLGYDYHNGNTYKHGNSYLLWEVDKDNIANQSAISLIIRATGICWNQVVCKGMAGKQRLCLKIKKLSETQRSK